MKIVVTLQCKREGKHLPPPRAYGLTAEYNSPRVPRFNRRTHVAAIVSNRRSTPNIDVLYCLAPRPPKTGQTVNGDTLREIDAKSKGRPRDGRVKKQKAPRCKPPPAVAFYRDRLTGLTDCGTGAGYCSLSVWTIRADIV